MFNLLADSIVVIGICILSYALILVRRLIMQLPHGIFRHRWQAMSVLIGLFITGYLGYAITFWHGHDGWHDLIVPGIFFFGAFFVRYTATTALHTVLDIRRVALLEQENITDPLIGIYNRRYMTRRLDEEFNKAKRYGIALSVLMLDLDHFKDINDRYGHQAGDLMLVHFGKLLLGTIRNTDIAARFGGEELVIIAPNTSASDATVLAERLRQTIAEHPLILASEHQPRQEISVTVSIGVSAFTQETVDSDTLVQQADAALYNAKQLGRNRVEVHEGLH